MTIRPARREDLEAVVGLLADDPLGRTREAVAEEVPAAYVRAFEAIAADEGEELVVAEVEGRVAAVLQLSFLPSLTYGGRSRAQIEGVRVARALRGEGVGRTLLEWAVERARARGCHMVQLTTDKRRPEALRFYEGLGFVASHEGMKLRLE